MPRIPLKPYNYDGCPSNCGGIVNDMSDVKLQVLKQRLEKEIEEAKHAGQDLFVCVENVTSYSDITKAINENKLPIVKQGKKYYYFITADWEDEELSQYYWFQSNKMEQKSPSEITDPQALQFLFVDKANHWQSKEIEIKSASSDATMGEDFVVDVAVGHISKNMQIGRATSIAQVLKEMLYDPHSDLEFEVDIYDGEAPLEEVD